MTTSAASPTLISRGERAKRIFVAEDEFLLAYALEEDLQANGFSVVGPYTRLHDARAAASHEEFDLALLDINMNGQMAYPIADILVERRIPFIFLSGYGRIALPEHLKDAHCVPKPYDPAYLISEVKRVTKCD